MSSGVISIVVAGLDPAIHLRTSLVTKQMDPRVKPGGDELIVWNGSVNDTTSDGSEKKGWFGRLAGGLKRTSSQLGSAIADLVTKGPMDPAKLDMIQDALVRADLGYDLAHRVTAVISQGRYSQSITTDEVKAVVAAEVAKI